MIEEPFPANHALVAIETMEKRPLLARNRIHREILESKGAEEEEEEEEEDYGEQEGEGEEGGEEDYGAEDYGEEETFPPKD